MPKFSTATLTMYCSLSVAEIRTLKQSSIGKCPHYIMMPGHYRADESCRCDDEEHTEMSEWGYIWDGATWTSDEGDF